MGLGSKYVKLDIFSQLEVSDRPLPNDNSKATEGPDAPDVGLRLGLNRWLEKE